MKNKEGIALILAVGILAVLAMVATTFSLNMRLEYKAAMNYYEGVKAWYLADLAIQKAIIALKTAVKQNAFDSAGEPWAQIQSKFVSSFAQWEIKDEQRKVNINNANQQLLGNLIDYCCTSSLDASAIAASIVGARDGKPNRRFLKKQEIKELLEGEYDAIKEYITIYSYEDTTDPGHTGRSPININTAEEPVLHSVLLVTGNIGLAYTLAYDIHTRVSVDPFESWDEFDDFIDNRAEGGQDPLGGFTTAMAAIVKNNCNPNRSNDKVTTEFCFHGGGYYEITGTGIIQDPPVEKEIKAIVKIFDIIHLTAKGDFDGASDWERVTWDNNCPVNSDALFSSTFTSPTAITIDDSIKLGFWGADDAGIATLPANWTWGKFRLRVKQNYTGVPATSFHDGGHIYFWEGASLSPHVFISHSPYQEWTGKIACRESVAQTGYGDFVQTERSDETYVDQITYLTPGNIDGMRYVRYPYYPAALWLWPNSDGVTYPDGWNAATLQPLEYIASLDSTARERVVQIDAPHETTGYGKRVYIDVYEETGGNAHCDNTFDSDAIPSTSGSISLTGSNVEWSDLRIITPTGNYTSQIIDSPTGTDVEWGTITGTLTRPESAPTQATFNVSFETSVDDGATWQSSNPTIAMAMTGDENFLYRATLTTDDTQETPILEDITITYLPETEIVSYSVSE
jgi:hypothetical protein